MKTELDKSKWANGEWDNEPDFVGGVDDETGYEVYIRRNSSGALCGYVSVPKGHPAYSVDYNSLPIAVHGGLTYGEQQYGDDKYMFGFDCNHYGDLSPLDLNVFGYVCGTYRNIEYVKEQVKLLAKQLKAMEV